MKNELLESWEATYKKGQLSLWILLALKEGPKYLAEIKHFITDASNDSISCEDQSLYRALRKFTVVEMVRFDLHKGDRGPDKKHYALTEMGMDILDTFTQRNIKPFFSSRLQNLMSLNS